MDGGQIAFNVVDQAELPGLFLGEESGNRFYAADGAEVRNLLLETHCMVEIGSDNRSIQDGFGCGINELALQFDRGQTRALQVQEVVIEINLSNPEGAEHTNYGRDAGNPNWPAQPEVFDAGPPFVLVSRVMINDILASFQK